MVVVEPPHRGDRDRDLDELPFHEMVRRSFRIREGADERVARRDLAKESLQELDAGVTRPAGYGGVEGLDLADDEDDMCAGISDSAGIC